MKIKKKIKIINGQKYEIGNKIFITGVIPDEYANDIDVCVCFEDGTHKMSIARLNWDFKEQSYELQSVGLRLCEYGNTKLLKWLQKVADKYTKKIVNEEKENESC